MQQSGRIGLAVLLTLGWIATAQAQDNGANGNALALSADLPAERPKSAAEALQRLSGSSCAHLPQPINLLRREWWLHCRARASRS